MRCSLLAVDADDAGETRGGVTDVVVVNAWPVGVTTAGVLVGTGTGKNEEVGRGARVRVRWSHQHRGTH